MDVTLDRGEFHAQVDLLGALGELFPYYAARCTGLKHGSGFTIWCHVVYPTW